MRTTVLEVSKMEESTPSKPSGQYSSCAIVSNVEAIRGLKQSSFHARGTNEGTKERRREETSAEKGRGPK